MANPLLAAETHKLITAYRKSGLSIRKIQAELQKKHGIKVCRGVVQKYAHMPHPEIKSNKKVGEMNWRKWIPAMKRMQELKSESSFSQDQAHIDLGPNRVALVNFSDQHMGAWSTNYDGLMRFTDEFLKIPNLWIALTGDYAHYAIKLRNVLEVSDNLLPPEQQTDFFESWFNEIWHKVAFATWDNHGVERQEKQAGESSVKRILSRKVIYFNGIGNVDLKVGGEIYKGVVSHKFSGRSIYNPVHAMMRYMRFEGVDREWALMGDSHTPGVLKYTDGEKVRVACNSGSIQDKSGYAKRYFSLKTHDVYPLICFDPDSHTMTPFWSVKEWLKS